ncbi:hypothetical protein MCC01966_10490 [Bifidobacteriaceae bacterium MCC01966]|nr:hypothetical protein MCC01966_10490 [Bifidobacteriaceae bacterium MCC01966]
MRERVREPVADDRDMRQIAQDNESNTRHTSRMADVQFGVSLVQAAQLGRANRLHEQAVRIEEDSNRKIGLLGKHAAETSRLIGKTLEAQSESNRILNGMAEQADRASRLLMEGMGALHEQGEQARLDQAYQAYAQWRQTDEGRQYLEWRDTARDTIARIEDYTRRMQAARQKDEELAVRELVAADPKGIMKEPEQPKTPPKPVMSSIPEPGPKPEEPARKLTRKTAFTSALSTIGGLAGIAYTILDNLRMGEYGLGPIQFIIRAAICWLIGVIIGAVARTIIESIRSKSAGLKENEREWEEYETSLSQWEERSMQYRRAGNAYEAAVAAWDRDYNQGGAYRRLKAEHDNRVLDYTDECARVAHSMFPPATRWAATNPMDRLRSLNSTMELVLRRQTEPDTWGDPTLPVLANVGSLPVYAPNMRAELALIQSENEGRPVRDAEPGEDADAPYEPITMHAHLG